MLIRAMLAATAAAILCSSVHAQSISQSVSTTVKAAMNATNGDPLPRGKARGGRHVLRAARRDREASSTPTSRRAACPARVIAVARQGQARLLRGVRFPRQGGRRRDDQGHDLQHRVDDQADGRARGAATAGARQAAGRRSALEILSEVRQHGGRRAGRQRRGDHRQSAGEAADHAAASDDAHLRARSMADAATPPCTSSIRAAAALPAPRWPARSSWTSSRRCRCSISPAPCGITASGSTCSGRWSRKCPGRRSASTSQENILKPLGMTDTGFFIPPEKAAALRQGAAERIPTPASRRTLHRC